MRCILNCHLLTILAHAEADSSLMLLLVGRGFRDLVRSGCNLGHNELISGKPRTRISEECGAIAGDFSDFRLSLHGGGEGGVGCRGSGVSDSQQPTRGQIIRICMEIYRRVTVVPNSIQKS